MHAEDLVLNAGRQREPVEQRVEARPRPQAVALAQPLYALYPEPEQRIDVRRLEGGEDLSFIASRCQFDPHLGRMQSRSGLLASTTSTAG